MFADLRRERYAYDERFVLSIGLQSQELARVGAVKAAS